MIRRTPSSRRKEIRIPRTAARVETLEGRLLLVGTILPPAATTLAATAVAPTSATLNGSVTPSGPTDALFQYSTDPTLSPHVVTTFAGTAGVTGAADGNGPNAQFRQPEGVAADSAGNVYVADSGNNTIRKISAGGVVSTFAGTAGVTGATDGPGTSALFNDPFGLAVDGTGNVYVADMNNHVIRKITPLGVVSTVAGAAGKSGSADGNGGAARFSFPEHVAVDSTGNLFVADSNNNTVRKITPSGDVTTLAGKVGVFGSADGVGAAASFNLIKGVAVDSADNVYVSDVENGTIRKITQDGTVTTFAGTVGTFGGADGTGPAASFNDQNGLTTDAAGNVYVADHSNQLIRKITPAGVVTTLAGIPTRPGNTDGTGPTALFRLPESVAVDGAGNVYVADSNNDTIRKISIASVTAQTGVTGTTAVPESLALTGLQPGTTYFYRAVASNPGGMAFGSIVSFATTTSTAATTTTMLTSSLNPSQFGVPVTLTATVAKATNHDGKPVGKVTFDEGTNSLGTGTIDNNGIATSPPLTLSVGKHTITAVYGGDATFASSTSMPLDQTVERRSTTTTVSSSANPATVGQDIAFTASVDAVTYGAGASQLAESVTFSVDGVVQTPPVLVTVVNGHGQAAFPTKGLAAGVHTIVAAYSGGIEYAPSTSKPFFETVKVGSIKVATTTALTSAPDPSAVGQQVKLSAEVTPQFPATSTSALAVHAGGVHARQVTLPSGAPPFAGSVTFKDGSTVLGVVKVKADGSATLTTTFLTPGQHFLTATFAGDPNYLTSTSGVDNQVVLGAVDGPQVVSVRRFGFHNTPTTLVIGFNAPLDFVSARNPANYRISDAHGRSIGVGVAAFDPAASTVTLDTVTPLDLHRRYTLTIVGTAPGGISGLDGVLLDGAGTGRPGSDYVTTVDAANLVVTNTFAAGASAALKLAAWDRAHHRR